MLKDCLIKREIIGKELQNFEDKKKQITAALPKMKAAEANQYKQVLASLDKGIALSKTGIGNQEAEFRSMLLFYKQTVENTRKVPQSLFDEELKGIGQEMSGKAPHLVKQNASLQIYRKHVAALRGGKLALLSSDALRKDILSLIPKGEMIHKRRGKNLSLLLYSPADISISLSVSGFFGIPRTTLSSSIPFPLWCSPHPAPFPLAFLPYLTCDTAFLFPPFAEMPDALGKS